MMAIFPLTLLIAIPPRYAGTMATGMECGLGRVIALRTGDANTPLDLSDMIGTWPEISNRPTPDDFPRVMEALEGPRRPELTEAARDFLSARKAKEARVRDRGPLPVAPAPRPRVPAAPPPRTARRLLHRRAHVS